MAGRGRPRIGLSRTVCLPDGDWTRLREHAERLGTSVSDLVRTLVAKGLDELTEEDGGTG